MDEYKEIIDLEKFEPNSKHPRMSIYNRSAIFAPFAALTGFEEEVEETERITDKEIELNDDLKAIINDKLIRLEKNQEVNLVRFVSNSNSNLGGEMGDFAISATPDFTSLNIHRNVGSSKYTGKTVGPMTVSLSGPDFNVNKRVNVVEDKSKTQLKGNNVVLKDPSQSANCYYYCGR